MFLPTTIKEVRARGWEQLDVILFSGDAYIDHPAFGAAVIGRLLEAEGYRVAIVPQPNWRDDLRDFINFTNLFSASLDLEQDIHREHVRFNDKLFDVVVFNIDKKQIVGGIIEDVTNMEMKKEQIAEKAKEVIHKNLATVQQIACTLGEHMAETEVLLRSIAKDFAADDEQSSDLTIRTNSNKRDY